MFGNKWNFMTPLVVAVLLLASLNSISLGCPCSQVPKPESPGPTLDRLAGIQFTHTPEYRKEFRSAIAEARKAVLNQDATAQRLAIVSDIDETLLDNRLEFQTHPDFKWSDFEAWMNQAKAPVLKRTADFLKWARARGYAIFLITGRPEKDRAATIANLIREGVSYDGLYMRPDKSHTLAEDMKTAYRKNIEDMGFKIVVNIGDQFSDLYGGNAIECIKLPNKMYYIP